MNRLVGLFLLAIVFQADIGWSQSIGGTRSGEDLVQFLRQNYRPTQRLNYGRAREKMFTEIDNRGGRVRCVYTGAELATTRVPNHTVMNTEHTWPRSKFREQLPMDADLHHLFPTLSQPNNRRGSFPFAEIPDRDTQSWWLSNNPQSNRPAQSDIDNYSESINGAFEPREDHKGNVARAMFYFWVIYRNNDIQPQFISSQLPTLAQWHINDPVDATETARNAAIQAFQGNENPFVVDSTLVQRVMAPVSPRDGRNRSAPLALDVANDSSTNRAARLNRESSSQPVSMRVISWNLQSDSSSNERESNPDFIKGLMAEKNGVHIWGLSEVLSSQVLRKFEEGAEDGEGSDFVSVLSTTGDRDRLAVIYDSGRFEQVGPPLELKTETRLSSGLRASLGVRLKVKNTGQEFIFLVSHLKRGGAQNPIRLKQSQNLNTWVQTQTLPVIAVGDFNYDYDVVLGDAGLPNRDGGFDALIANDRFRWVKPDFLVKTQSSPEFNSVLDFIFVANEPLKWTGTSRILDREGDQPATTVGFSDDNQNTDHRPVEAVFTLEAPSVGPFNTRMQIETRIRHLEAELNDLRSQLEEM